MSNRDDRRHRYALMMSAHREEWIKYGRKQFTTQHKNDLAAIRAIFAATSQPSAAKIRIDTYLKGPARQGWMMATRAVWIATGHATIRYMHDYLTGNNVHARNYAGIYIKQDDTEVAPILDSWENRVNSDIKAGGDKITGITDTEQANVTKAMADGQAAGLGHYEIGQAVDQQLTTTWPGRGETISRTEVNSAMNKATLQDANAAAPDLNKVWSTTGMDNVREWHADADGQSVAQSDTFTVMGEDMDCPGDDAGSPENVINCACCLLFEEAEAEMGEGEEQGGDNDYERTTEAEAMKFIASHTE